MIFKGYKLAQKLIEELGGRVAPTQEFVVVQVGNDPVSDLYVSKKKEIADELGVNFRHLRFKQDISEEELIGQISKLNSDLRVKGILIQMPLPSHIERVKIAKQISKDKDVDGFNFILGEADFKTYPPTILAIDEILDFYQIKKEGKKILIIGGGFLVGAPLKVFWENKKLKPSTLGPDDEKYEQKIKESDIVVMATGGGGRFSSKDFKSGATVIDASTVSDDGKIRGDIGPENWPEDKNLVPVPGGVGPVTVAQLYRNFFNLSQHP